MLTKIKEVVKTHQADIILIVGIFLISLFSFFEGYITAKIQEKGEVIIEESNTNSNINLLK